MISATITQAANGAHVRFSDSDTTNDIMPFDMVYQFDTIAGDVGQLVHMVCEVLEQLGWAGDRRDSERLSIAVTHGDKFEHETETQKFECSICNKS